MDKPASYYISIVAALVALFGLSVFFALCETSFSSLSRIKLKNMAAAKGKHGGRAAKARLALKLLETYDKLLSSVLIGNTIVNVLTSALATVLFIGLFGAKGVSIAAVSVTISVLIFGEISPKTLAKESPEITALNTAPLLRFFTIIFAPLNYLAAAWRKIIVKIFPAKTDRAVTEDELLTFVEEVRQEGGINRQEEQMIRQVIEFDDITAAEIVTPRVDLEAVSENDSAEEIDRIFTETGFSRLPVYHENLDRITGVLLLKDFRSEVVKNGRAPLEIVKPVIYVTKTIKISRLLKTLQEKQSHMAVLIDEFGGTLGIVTIEDIIEELVGEIWDEHDEVIELFKLNDDGSFTVLASANFQDMLDFIGEKAKKPDLPDDPETLPSTTVGNWIMENSGGLPFPGEDFAWQNLRINVSKVHRHRVMEVTVTVT
ncbi:MAG: hemolysin family protein [Treponema sp.]|nr:hemolysin family protein [Treponema sp.]